MNEYNLLVRRMVRFTMYLTVVWIVLWAVLPVWKSVFAGLSIGSAVSIYFALSTARQAELAGDIALKKAGRKPATQMGFRFLMILAGVMVYRVLSEKWGYISFPAVVLGMVTYPLLAVGMYVRQITTKWN